MKAHRLAMKIASRAPIAVGRTKEERMSASIEGREAQFKGK